MKYVFILFVIVLICIFVYMYYNHILRKYFVVNDTIVYDYFLKHFIQIVSQDNYFMNYGLWDNDHRDLHSANKNLANFVFGKACIEKKNVKILDVGCGYGEQDMLWTNEMTTNEMTTNEMTTNEMTTNEMTVNEMTTNEMTTNEMTANEMTTNEMTTNATEMKEKSHITAVDISETQISEAIERRNQRDISDKQLTFEVCDAMKLDEKYSSGQFDVVFSLESAFHYSDRPKFFANVNSVLKENGVFVISDILLNKDYKQSIINDLFLKIYSDFLHIPKQNLIDADKWKQQVKDAGFELVEYNDITAQTFGPYYKHFMHTYFKNKNLPSWMADIADNLFQNIQPFTYTVSTLSTFGKSGAKSNHI